MAFNYSYPCRENFDTEFEYTKAIEDYYRQEYFYLEQMEDRRNNL